jgi:uncharacterized protein DUF1707
MPDDLPDLRASHEDRDRVVDALRVAGGDGRLTAEELDAGWSVRFPPVRSASWPGSPPTCRARPQPGTSWWSGSTAAGT